MSPTDIVAAYLQRRLELIISAVPGGPAARELSDLTDRTVSEIADTALGALGTAWSLVALGGWGARRLVPGSDLDFLVVTDAAAAELKPALEAVLYPLWDAGLRVGHQVRSRRDHLHVVRQDLDTLTATLTGRHLAGDAALSGRLLAETASSARKRAKRLIAELARRERAGSPYLLEPDLKEGAGGQRDLDELVWIAAILTGAPAHCPSVLVGAGVISPDEGDRLERAGDRITAARWALHVASARATSFLSLDAADADVPLGGLHAAMADAHHLLPRVRGRALGRPLAWDAPDVGALGALDLFTLLASGTHALAEIEDAAWCGRLDDLVPGFGDLMTLRRPALGHLYTVGAHSLRCAAIAAEVAARGGTEAGPRLLAAALTHDLGKVHSGPGHPARSAAMLKTIAPRLGLSAQDAADAQRLVAEHLLLAETSASHDIHDEDVLLHAAARVGRFELLDDLRALSEADAVATGPGAWTPWHAALVGELADRLAAALSEDVDGSGMVERAEAVRAEAMALLGPDPGPAPSTFVRDAHVRYLAANHATDVVAHATLAAEAASHGARMPGVAVSPGPADRTWRVTVAARDRHGLFAAITGALALAGLDILSAGAFAAPGDVGLDILVVRPDTLADADASTFATFERYLVAALDDHLELGVRLDERRRAYARSPLTEPIVSVEPTGAYATAVYVTAGDRVGLLHDIARAIAECGLDILWARATTLDGVARDVFHVVDSDGEPIDDPGELGHLAMRIRERASRGL